MRVPVTDLVGRPGDVRVLTRTLARDDVENPELSWGQADDCLTGAIELRLHLESVVEGILARGTLEFATQRPCARCLTPQSARYDVDVAELFVDPRRREEGDEDDPGYEIVDDLTAIDLSTLIRDTVVMSLPLRVLCSDDCAGLCPVCGSNRNDEDCGHRPEQAPDPRWAKLSELNLPPA